MTACAKTDVAEIEQTNAITSATKVIENADTKMIAEKTGADLLRIQPTYDYPETYKECTETIKKEQEEKDRPELSDTIDNISEYDVIYVGYPIWWSDMPMVVYTFLESYDFMEKLQLYFVRMMEVAWQVQRIVSEKSILEHLC